MYARIRAMRDSPGARPSWCGSLPRFTPSAVHGGFKPPKSKHNKTPAKSKATMPDMLQNLPPALRVGIALVRMDYAAFVEKLEKLNPGVELTKQQADWALEETILKSMPKNKREPMKSKFRDSGARQRPKEGGAVQGIKKLQSASKAYWARRDKIVTGTKDESSPDGGSAL